MPTNKPILLLPAAEEAKRNNAPRGGPELIHFPSHSRQAERLAPQFSHLQKVYDDQRSQLQVSPDGAIPEQVLVLETIGAVEDFVKAVNRIRGMEWMGELDEEDIPPDDDFFYKTKDGQRKESGKQALGGRLYMIMTNHQAMGQLLSLWKRYKRDKNYKFPDGQTKWCDVFKRLQDIRAWGVQDRLRETGVLADWNERVRQKEKTARFEVELWFRSDKSRRDQQQMEIEASIVAKGGTILDKATISDIAYHAVLAEMPIAEIRRIIQTPDTDLVKCEQVMFFRPVGQTAVALLEGETTPLEKGRESPPPKGVPVVAILDGMPLENHCLLGDRVVIDDPDDWQRECEARHRRHGTAMASLVVHGELDDHGPALARPVYVRPILKPDSREWGTPQESVPENVLEVDLVHRAVKRIFEGDGQVGAAAPSVRIINLSVGDRSRPFCNAMSPWARLLDWLSWKYGVLFVLSAGNCLEDITLDVARDSFATLAAEERERAVIAGIAESVRHRRLLAPAESINALTVGALHEDSSTPRTTGRLINPYSNDGLPSPLNCIGLGYRRSVKPDVLMPGGRQLCDEKLGNTDSDAIIELREATRAPGQRVAVPGTSGDLSQTCYRVGTSNAAALTSRLAAQYCDVLSELRESDSQGVVVDSCVPSLLKAAL